MSNYFWTANGNYIKQSIYEHLNNNFSVTDDKFCIQDTCLSKSEMILLKESVANYNIFQNVNDKDILTIREVREYLREIFRIIHTSEDDERKKNINNYLAYGLKDTKMGAIYKFEDKYNEIDFNKLYMAIPDIEINTGELSEDKIQNILNTNLLIDPRDELKRFVVTNNNITSISHKQHYFVHNGLEFWLVKPKTNDYYWKLIIFWDDLINEGYNNLDTQYKEAYKTNFDSINTINIKETITKIEYNKLLDDLKVVSIKDGSYDYDSFKDNIFIKQYNILLNLDTITKEYFDSVIYESNKFQLSEISDDDVLTELKTRLGVDFVGTKHYILDETESYNIRLLRVKYPNNENFQWQILYLENKSFIEYNDPAASPVEETTTETVEETTTETVEETTTEPVAEQFNNMYINKGPIMDNYYIRFFK